jgi:hypothetical protein
MTTLDTRPAVSAQPLSRVNDLAHVHTFHPHALPWERAYNDEELRFLSRVAFGEEGHEQASVAYVVKELAQLAEIERHVSAVMAIALSQLQNDDGPLGRGTPLHDAISCFAAEELNHSNAFHRYVREMSGADFAVQDNLFQERLDLYLGSESPYVKLAALCCTAYIGESLMMVFERRTRTHDPKLAYFLPTLLHLHNLDEERHIQVDHWIINELIPSLSEEEMSQLRSIVLRTEELNFKLAGAFEVRAKEFFGLDYTDGNLAAALQMRLTIGFATQVLTGTICPVDEAIDDETRRLVADFSGADWVHTPER